MCRVSNVKIKTGYCLHYKTDYPDGYNKNKYISISYWKSRNLKFIILANLSAASLPPSVHTALPHSVAL